jgi:hypothetical protein
MDAFQGCYKDGTNGSRDCRWLAGLYLVVFLGVTASKFFIHLFGFGAVVLLLLTTMLQPYKANVHYRIKIFFLLVSVFVEISAMARLLASPETLRFKHFAISVFALSISIPVIYIVIVILYKLFAHRMWTQKLYQMLCRICIKQDNEDFTRMLPERMVRNVLPC